VTVDSVIADMSPKPRSIPLEEVKEVVELPELDSLAAQLLQDPDLVEIPAIVADQLHDLVSAIANWYVCIFLILTLKPPALLLTNAYNVHRNSFVQVPPQQSIS
jgi:hypothetical protein